MSLRLPIGLRMEGCAIIEPYSEVITEVQPEFGGEKTSPICYNRHWHTEFGKYFFDKDIAHVLSFPVLSCGYVTREFRIPVYRYQDGVINLPPPNAWRKVGYKVHCSILSRSLRDWQRHQFSVRLMSWSLDLMTTSTGFDITFDVSSHFRPVVFSLN